MKITIKYVQKFLNTYFNQPALNIVELKGGEWSQAFGFEITAKSTVQKYVVKFGQHPEDYYKDQAAAEFSSKYLPIPKVIDIGKTADGYFVISEQAEGVMIDHLDAKSMKAIVPAVFLMLDEIRQIDDKSAIVTKSISWQQQLLSVDQDKAGGRISGWRKKLTNSPAGIEPFIKIYHELCNLVEVCPDANDLIHQDLLHFNLLTNSNKISAVIDWGNAIRGDFLYDVAWLSYCAMWFPAMKDIDWELEARKHYQAIGLDVTDFEARIKCYKLHICLDAQVYNSFMERWDQLDINIQAGNKLLT